MKKLLVLLSLCSIKLVASDNQLDVVGKNIFSTVWAIALGSRNGKIDFKQDPKPELIPLASSVGYELIINGGIPAYLATPNGYTKLIGEVNGNLDDVTADLFYQLDLSEIKEPSQLTRWYGGKRYSVQNRMIFMPKKAKL